MLQISLLLPPREHANTPLNQFPETEVASAIESLDPSTASGPFLFNNQLMIEAGHSIVPLPTFLFNLIVETKAFPDYWKPSYITPIPRKSTDMTLLSNWRPITLLHALSELFETVFAGRLRSWKPTN